MSLLTCLRTCLWTCLRTCVWTCLRTCLWTCLINFFKNLFKTCFCFLGVIIIFCESWFGWADVQWPLKFFLFCFWFYISQKSKWIGRGFKWGFNYCLKFKIKNVRMCLLFFWFIKLCSNSFNRLLVNIIVILNQGKKRQG